MNNKEGIKVRKYRKSKKNKQKQTGRPYLTRENKKGEHYYEEKYTIRSEAIPEEKRREKKGTPNKRQNTTNFYGNNVTKATEKGEAFQS